MSKEYISKYTLEEKQKYLGTIFKTKCVMQVRSIQDKDGHFKPSVNIQLEASQGNDWRQEKNPDLYILFESLNIDFINRLVIMGTGSTNPSVDAWFDNTYDSDKVLDVFIDSKLSKNNIDVPPPLCQSEKNPQDNLFKNVQNEVLNNINKREYIQKNLETPLEELYKNNKMEDACNLFDNFIDFYLKKIQEELIEVVSYSMLKDLAEKGEDKCKANKQYDLAIKFRINNLKLLNKLHTTRISDETASSSPNDSYLSEIVYISICHTNKAIKKYLKLLGVPSNWNNQIREAFLDLFSYRLFYCDLLLTINSTMVNKECLLAIKKAKDDISEILKFYKKFSNLTPYENEALNKIKDLLLKIENKDILEKFIYQSGLTDIFFRYPDMISQVDKQGMCAGIVGKVQQDFLKGNLEKGFYSTLNNLHKFCSDNYISSDFNLDILGSMLEEYDNANKNEFKDFTQTIIDYYNSKNQNPTIINKDISLIHSYIGMYNLNDLQKYFEELKTIFANSPSNISLALDSHKHLIHVGYDTENQCWLFTNPNFLTTKHPIKITDSKELAESVAYAFKYDTPPSKKVELALIPDDNIAFSTEFYVSHTNQKNAEAIIDSLKNNKILQELHTVKHEINQLTDTKGMNLLILAAYKGKVEVINKIIEANPAINLDNAPETFANSLYLAVQGEHSEAVKALLDNDASVDSMNNPSGITPLFIAAQNGYTEIVKILLEYNANINLHTDIGNKAYYYTPLLLAIENGQKETVKLLLENNALQTVKMKTGEEIGILDWLKTNKIIANKNEIITLLNQFQNINTDSNQKVIKEQELEQKPVIVLEQPQEKECSLEELIPALNHLNNTDFTLKYPQTHEEIKQTLNMITKNVEKAAQENSSKENITALKKYVDNLTQVLNNPEDNNKVKEVKTECIALRSHENKYAWGKILGGLGLMLIGIIGIAMSVSLGCAATAATFGLAVPISLTAATGGAFASATLAAAGLTLFSSGLKQKEDIKDGQKDLNNFINKLQKN